MKISFIHGPGSAFGTFLQWKENTADPSIIKQTYAGQFYDIISEIKGTGQVICITSTGPTSDARFRFDTVHREGGSGLKYYLEEFRYARAVRAKIKDFDPDVIIVSSDFPTYFFDALPRRPVKILTMHNTFWKPYGSPTGLKEKILNFARKLSLRTTNLAVCVSLECQRQFDKIRSGNSTFSVIQIPRLIENFQCRKGRTPRRLLFVGRVEVNKGVADLIHAFKIVRHEFPDLELKIVGNGSAFHYMKELAAQLELDSVIEFTGRLDANGVSAAYANADVCICPTLWSFNEGLATVPLEAASYGIPTVKSHAVPAKEQFGADQIVFEPGNIDELAAKIRVLISSDQNYKDAQETARNSFLRTMREIADWKAGVYSCLNQVTNHS